MINFYFSIQLRDTVKIPEDTYVRPPSPPTPIDPNRSEPGKKETKGNKETEKKENAKKYVKIE